MSYESRPWLKNYDANVPQDIDPEEWNATLIDIFMPAFKDFPKNILCHFKGIDFTYEMIDQYSNQFANMLVENGLEPGDVVCLSLINIPQFIISYMGILKAGCVASGHYPAGRECHPAGTPGANGAGGSKNGGGHRPP